MHDASFKTFDIYANHFSFSCRNDQYGYDFAMFSEEEEEEESGHIIRNEYKERLPDHVVADIIQGVESFDHHHEFSAGTGKRRKVLSFREADDVESYFDPIYEETEEDFPDSQAASETEEVQVLDGDDQEEVEEEEENLEKRDIGTHHDSIGNSATNDCGGTRPVVGRVQNKSDLVTKFETHQGTYFIDRIKFQFAFTLLSFDSVLN